MNPIVEPVPDALLFDTDVPCTLATLLALRAVGFQGGIRTVTCDGAPDPSDLSAREVADFIAAGLGLMVYQRVRDPGWIPSAALGTADAAVLVAKAGAAGYLVGASVWDDLEGIGGSDVATIAYANAKAARLKAAERPPGEYIGDDVPLTGSQLFTSLIAPCYWRSLSNVPDVQTRGYAMRQIAEDVLVAGTLVDVNFATADRLGGRPFWMRNV